MSWSADPFETYESYLQAPDAWTMDRFIVGDRHKSDGLSIQAGSRAAGEI